MGLKLDRLVQGVATAAAFVFGGPVAGAQVLATTEGVVQGRRAADLQQEQQVEQRNLARLNRQKSIRRQVQQLQLLRAQTEARAQGTGTVDSSAAFGSSQALTSSAGRNILDITQTGQVEDVISGLSGDITGRRSRASTFQSISNIATSDFGQRAIRTIFD